MHKLVAAFLLLVSTAALAQIEDSDDKQRFCAERLRDTRAIQAHLKNGRNQLALQNRGGLFGGGVCWWHSRFTRNAAYVAIFRPHLPKPTDREARKIINEIRKGRPVEVPGYQNLYQFSVDYHQEIQRKLNEWQRNDGLLRARWTQGLSGSSATEAQQLEAMMDELYERVQAGEVVYQMLQMPGITAHAWLVLDMRPVTGWAQGYELQVSDSNFPGEVRRHHYYRGDASISYHGMTRFVPYTRETNEEERLRQRLSETCQDARGPRLNYQLAHQ
jgi:hypothetical protein